MTETTGRRRSRQSRTQFDRDSRQIATRIVIGAAVLLLIAVAAVLINLFSPDLALSLVGGGFGKNHNAIPRNTDIWVVYPDGSLRFATIFQIEDTASPVSAGLPVAGPYVNKAEDVLNTRYFGALNIARTLKTGVNSDSSRVYYEYTIERDPNQKIYGINVLTSNPPYIEDGKPDPTKKIVAFGAPPQKFYNQVIVVVVFPPGTVVDNLDYVVPKATATPSPSGQTAPSVQGPAENMLRPYRKLTFNGWTAYYFDTTFLTENHTIRLYYKPPQPSGELLDPDIFAIDANR